MTGIAPMLGAIMGVSKPPKGEDKKRAVKPKTPKRGTHKVTKGEMSVTQPAQQHGELASYKEPKTPTDHQMMKDHARHEMRRATEDWVSGRLTTPEHSAVHARASHVLSGRSPRDFHGKTGDRKMKGWR